MGLRRRILDQEVYSIDKELLSLIKNKESLEYLTDLIHKRDRIANQIDRIDQNILDLKPEPEKGAS